MIDHALRSRSEQKATDSLAEGLTGKDGDFSILSPKTLAFGDEQMKYVAKGESKILRRIFVVKRLGCKKTLFVIFRNGSLFYRLIVNKFKSVDGK